MDIRGGTNLSGVTIIDKYRVPNAPIIGTATVLSFTSASISFTAPTYTGNQPILSYTAVSNPGGITSTITQSGSGTITLSGLTENTSYTFTVYATNIIGNSVVSSASNQITMPKPDQQVYTTAGTYTWIAPVGVTSVSVVCVGSGGAGPGTAGGGGGALSYTNNYPVTSGQTYEVRVGSLTTSSYFGSASILYANPGSPGSSGVGATGGGGGGAGGYSGNGGRGGQPSINNYSGGAGGTGGGTAYSGGGSGGAGGNSATNYLFCGAGVAGSGGGGGGGSGGGQMGGGGVGLLGQGANGLGGASVAAYGTPVIQTQGGGSGGGYGTSNAGGLYGGGGTSSAPTPNGAVRIIWPGNVRYFPSTRTTDE